MSKTKPTSSSKPSHANPTQGTIEGAAEADLDAQAAVLNALDIPDEPDLDTIARTVVDVVMQRVGALLDARLPVFVHVDEANPTKSYSAQGRHVFQLGRSFKHVVPIPRMGGQMTGIYSTDEERARGILRISFAQATRLVGFFILP